MLRLLCVKNVVLIDELKIEFQDGLSVLTGETGAGKSILLDALGLALGARADKNLVRLTTNNIPSDRKADPPKAAPDKAVVSAVFDLKDLDQQPRLKSILEELDIELQDLGSQGELILRRSLTCEGKSKCFINDHPVALNALKRLADELIEIHGQFDRILDASTHLNLLDQYAQHQSLKAHTKSAYGALAAAQKAYQETQAKLNAQQSQQEFLEFALKEFDALNPAPGEEEVLLEKRHRLKNFEKVQDTYSTLTARLEGEGGVSDQLGQLLTFIERQGQILGESLQEKLLNPLNHAHTLILDVASSLQSEVDDLEIDESLESVEDRLYDLRALARKHGCTIAELPDLHMKFQEERALFQGGDGILEKLKGTLENAKKEYLESAKALQNARLQKAKLLEEAIMKELAPLKLEKAAFKIRFQTKPEAAWNKDGIDEVLFEVRTNPGQNFGPIDKIASGGERSRFMLAAKVVLAQNTHASILIFDEIDAGVGGAVASAIGERMARLGQTQQVLAITHSPQVAAHATTHYYVSKDQDSTKERTTTSLKALSDAARLEELARMLSGDHITDAARLAAQHLVTDKNKKTA